jgi:hypothetical protein
MQQIMPSENSYAITRVDTVEAGSVECVELCNDSSLMEAPLHSKKSTAMAKIDGPMGHQSGVTHLTDGTDKVDNYTSRKKRAPVERATRPGVQHVTGEEHNDVEQQTRVKDPRRKHNSASRSA